MRSVLRPGAVVVRRDADHLQVGTAPGSAYVLRDRPGLLDLLRSLNGVQAAEDVRPERSADQAALVRSLHAAAVVLDADAWESQRDPGMRAEARHLTARATAAAEVAERMRRRSAARVELGFDLDSRPLAEKVAVALADAGVGASLEPLRDPTMVVVVSVGPCPRDALETLAGAGITHLPVCVDETRVRIGPLVRPGATPCVACDDHQRTSWDRAWPVVLAQLPRPLARRVAGQPHALSAVTLHVAAAAVTAEVLAACDERGSHAEGATLTVGPDAYDLAVEPVPFSERCGCRLLSGPVSPHHVR